MKYLLVFYYHDTDVFEFESYHEVITYLNDLVEDIPDEEYRYEIYEAKLVETCKWMIILKRRELQIYERRFITCYGY